MFKSLKVSKKTVFIVKMETTRVKRPVLSGRFAKKTESWGTFPGISS